MPCHAMPFYATRRRHEREEQKLWNFKRRCRHFPNWPRLLLERASDGCSRQQRYAELGAAALLAYLDRAADKADVIENHLQQLSRHPAHGGLEQPRQDPRGNPVEVAQGAAGRICAHVVGDEGGRVKAIHGWYVTRMVGRAGGLYYTGPTF